MQSLYNEDAILTEKAFHSMSAAIQAYLVEDGAKKKEESQKTIKIEKEQDKLRSQIIKRLFTKEKMDKIVDECEIVVRKCTRVVPLAFKFLPALSFS